MPEKKLLNAIFALSLAVGYLPQGFAVPIDLTVLGDNYNQTFTFPALARSGTSSVLPPGWAMSTTTYVAGSGTVTTGGMRSYGPSPTQDDRALGSLTSSVTGQLLYGAEFRNATGLTIEDLDVQFIGEQWRRGANNQPDTLFFQYSLNATSLMDAAATWISTPALDFTSPQTGAPGTALNGNLLSNRVLKQELLSGVNIANNATFWFRWRDMDINGNDHGLAVDDFQLTPLAQAVPVPDALSLLMAGLLALMGATRARSAWRPGQRSQNPKGQSSW